MLQFIPFSEAERDKLLILREGEKRIGEEIRILRNEDLKTSSVDYVLLGAKEDVGVRINNGLGGADTNWECTIQSFLNLQSNQYFQGQNIGILGHWEVSDSGYSPEIILNQLDEELANTISNIISSGKIPILIGGGHNNSFGLIKGFSISKERPINVINLDPHADLRYPDVRHSGNGFSFAKKNGYLHKYFILGLHETYNNQFILDSIRNDKYIHCLTFEDVFIKEKHDWNAAIELALGFFEGEVFGVELDIDSVENALSSAMTPLGISPQNAARFLYKMGGANSQYLHIAEGVMNREDGLVQRSIGKLISYFIQSFIKGKEHKK